MSKRLSSDRIGHIADTDYYASPRPLAMDLEIQSMATELQERRTADLMTEEVEALGNILSSIATLCAQHRTFHGEAAADAEFGPGLRVLAKIIAGAWVKP